MKRKAGEDVGSENLEPKVQPFNAINPSKRFRSVNLSERGSVYSPSGGYEFPAEWDQEDSTKEKELLESMGVHYLDGEDSEEAQPSSKSVSNNQRKVTSILQPRNTNKKNEEHDNVEVDSGIVDGSWPYGESLDCSALSVGSYDGSSSYVYPPSKTSLPPSKYSLAPDLMESNKFVTYQRKLQPMAKIGSKEKVAGTDMINIMSEEVVLSIFRWLPKSTLARCSRVCKRWNRLVEDETLWRRLDLGLATVFPGVLGQVVSRGCQVLRLARASVKPPVFVSQLTGRLSLTMDRSKLQYLDLSMASISSACLDKLLSSCNKLRNLSMEMNTLSDEVCLSIGENKGLQVLHLGGVSGLTSQGVDRILSGCLHLTELNLGWTNLDELAVSTVVTKLPTGLQRLCLSGNRESLTDDHLDSLTASCPNLKELDVSDATKLTALTITHVVERLACIESLSTSRCYGITPSSYLMLSTACPALLYLNVFGLLRDPALLELRERLKGIEINKFMFTSVARPTVGIKRTSIWNLRVRD